jgi:hypothetical protein
MKGFVRPEIRVLPASALIPERNLISPPPNQFTHELTRPLPFYFTTAQQSSAPDGHFPAGTKVVLLAYDGSDYCRVVDEQGLYVEIEHGSLTKL